MIPRSSLGVSSGDSSVGSNGVERERQQQQQQQDNADQSGNEAPLRGSGGTLNAASSSPSLSQPLHQPHTSISSTFSATSYHNDPYGLQQLEQQQLYAQQQQQTTIQRSSPIAIIRSPGDGNNNNSNNNGMKKQYRDSDSDDKDDFDVDDDDDDSEIDVEKDAIKLQKKYGATIVQTYQATTSTDNLLNKTKRSGASSILNAPYLGSLSRSANQVLSLPPMSLAGETLFRSDGDGDENNGEPPETITSYGSLRDSHKRGRFLDGPSSYREPTSGRIRQLDHRLRYHGRSSELSIGERMQQSRKLKEIRQKELAKQQTEGPDDASAADGASKPAAKSSLSAIMNEASRKSRSEDKDITATTSSHGEEILLPIKMDDDNTPTFRDNDKEYYNAEMMDEPSMLSTSLTAFEMLKMSNVSTEFAAAMSMSQSSSRLVSTTTTTSAIANVSLQAPPSSGFESDDQKRFQPLARSMSDPTPHLRQLSLHDTTRQDVSHSAANAAAAAATTGIVFVNPHHQQQQQQLGMQMISPQYPLAGSGTAINANFGYAAAAVPLPTTSTSADHDPDTDGAFGDMDME